MYHTPNRRRYEARLLRVIAHIHDNLDGDLSLDRLADIACMSRFHWHRIFHAVTGETISATIRRVRLNRAAEWMLQNAAPVSEVALRFGFSSRQSFVRAFTETFAVSPARFRAARHAAPAFELRPIGRYDMMDVTIAERPATPLAALTHQGDYRELGRTFAQLFALLKTRNLTHTGAPLAIFYGDPDVVPEAELRAHAAIPVAAGTPLQAPMEAAELPAGRYAKATYRGPYAGLKDAWDWFCDVWLAQQSEQPARAPSFEIYISDPAITAPDDLITELYVQLKR